MYFQVKMTGSSAGVVSNPVVAALVGASALWFVVQRLLKCSSSKVGHGSVNIQARACGLRINPQYLLSHSQWVHLSALKLQ